MTKNEVLGMNFDSLDENHLISLIKREIDGGGKKKYISISNW